MLPTFYKQKRRNTYLSIHLSLCCLLLFFGKCMDIHFCIPLSSTLLAFVLWETCRYSLFQTRLVYNACFCSLGSVWIITISHPSRLLSLLLFLGQHLDPDIGCYIETSPKQKPTSPILSSRPLSLLLLLGTYLETDFSYTYHLLCLLLLFWTPKPRLM